MMKIFYKISLIAFSFTLIFFNGCGDDPEPGLWPTFVSQDKPAPVINTITSEKQALAGVTVITINGENFSPISDENRVYFNGVRGEIINSTPTQIAVKVPLVSGDSVQIKISSFKVEDFSNVFIYKIDKAVDEYFSFDPVQVGVPNAITFDNTGNLFVSLADKGIWKLTPQKTISQFIPKGAETKWDALRIFSNGTVHATKNIRGVWRLFEGVVPRNAPWGLPPASTLLKDFDFDANMTIWAVGTNSSTNNSLYKIEQQDSVAKIISFVATLRAVRVFNNFLYVAGLKSGVEGVWRFPIDGSGNLGTEELYFNLTDTYPSVRSNAMTFSEDGNLFLGTNQSPNPIIMVKPDRSSEILYEGVFPGNEVISMYWPQGSKLFITQASGAGLNQTVRWVDIQKPGAQYYNQ